MDECPLYGRLIKAPTMCFCILDWIYFEGKSHLIKLFQFLFYSSFDQFGLKFKFDPIQSNLKGYAIFRSYFYLSLEKILNKQ